MMNRSDHVKVPGQHTPVDIHDCTLLIGHEERVVSSMLQQSLHLGCKCGVLLEVLWLCMWCVCVCVVCVRCA